MSWASCEVDRHYAGSTPNRKTGRVNSNLKDITTTNPQPDTSKPPNHELHSAPGRAVDADLARKHRLSDLAPIIGRGQRQIPAARVTQLRLAQTKITHIC